MLRHRAQLVRLRTLLRNRIHAVLADHGHDRPGGCWSGPGRAWLAGLPLPAASREVIDDDLALIDALQIPIDRLDWEVHQRARSEPAVRVLTQLPGVGPFTALVILAEAGDVARFGSARKLAAWAGLTPSVRGSDLTVRHGHISKMACARRNGSAAAIGGVCDGGGRTAGSAQGQLTFDYIDLGTGESWRGRISPADRESLRGWLSRFEGARDVDFAVEGCTGWRYVVEELQQAKITAHLAEPAETANRRGTKRRAKTDWADARHLRQLVAEGRVPESWIPPAHVLETRALVRLYKDLLEERTSWQQRVHATLFHQGIPVVPKLGTADGLRRLAAAKLSAAGRQAVGAGVRQIDRLNAEMTPLRRELVRFSSRQPGCRALRKAHYGIGGLLSAAVWAELGNCHRFASSDDAVRYSGLDITFYDSDGKRARGHIARQGSPVLRWALYEAALYASRPASPDYACFCRVRERIDGQRALLSIARKLARRCYHTLRDLGDEAWQPAA